MSNELKNFEVFLEESQKSQEWDIESSKNTVFKRVMLSSKEHNSFKFFNFKLIAFALTLVLVIVGTFSFFNFRNFPTPKVQTTAEYVDDTLNQLDKQVNELTSLRGEWDRIDLVVE